VPLVDVMLVLLIIFMVAAPMIQRGIDVKLPQSRRATQVTGERVEITMPDTIRQSRVVFVGKDRGQSANLAGADPPADGASANKEVFLRGDSAVQYQDLMDVIDALKAAGVQNIGMVARMPASADGRHRRAARADADPAGLQRMISVSSPRTGARGGADLARGGLLGATHAADADDDLAQRQRRSRDGGMTALGGRPVQAVTPPEEPPSASGARRRRQDARDDVPLPNAKTVKATPPRP
jgi:biopolymer transport protein ExbD